MKVHLQIDPQLSEDQVTIEAREHSPEVQGLLDFLHHQEKGQERIPVKKGESVYLLHYEEIYRIFIENRVVQLETEKELFSTALRLYQVKELLPADFLQVSQSEIIHLKWLDHLRLTPNGLTQLVMKNGRQTYSSRRYLSTIKEALGL